MASVQLTDEELWHILQVEPPAKPPPREPGGPTDPWRAWIEWAKIEVLSGVGEIAPSRDKMERCSVYLARLVRLLNDLAKSGIARATGLRREDGRTLYEEGYVKALLGNGWEACGYAAGRVENTLRLATQDGLLFANDYDDWRAGMASGSGVRTYYGLTFKGEKQADIASTMWLWCDEASEETGQGCGPERVAAERTEAPETERTERNVEVPPPSGDTMPEMTPEERKTAGLGVLMLLAQTYYTLLESAISITTRSTPVDLQLNESYLWTVKALSNLLNNHEGLEDFPMKFEPPFPDLFPSRIGDVDWQYMGAPEAERFLSTVQKYVMDKGTYLPEERSPAWVFIEMFKPGINAAIEAGVAFRKRMNHDFEKVMDHMVKTAAGRIAGPAPAVATTAPEPQIQKPLTPPEVMERGSITTALGIAGDVAALEPCFVSAFQEAKELVAHRFAMNKTLLVFPDVTVEIDTTSRSSVRNMIPTEVAPETLLEPGGTGQKRDAPVIFEDGREERLPVFFKAHDGQRLRIVKHIQKLMAHPGRKFTTVQTVSVDGEDMRVFEGKTDVVPTKNGVLMFLETEAIRYTCAVAVEHVEGHGLSARHVTRIDAKGGVTFSSGKTYPLLSAVKKESLPEDLQVLRLRQLELERAAPRINRPLRKGAGVGEGANRRNVIEIAGRARRIDGHHSEPGKVLVLVLDGNEVAELVFLDACAEGGAAGKILLPESFFGWRIPPHQLDSLLTSEDLTGKRKDDPQSYVMATWRAAESTLAGVEGAPDRVGSGWYWCRATMRPRTRADGDLLYVDDEEQGTARESLHADVLETRKEAHSNTLPVKDTGAGTTALSEGTGEAPKRKERSIFAGTTDYTAVPLADIIAHLRDWKSSTDHSCALLRKYKMDLASQKRALPQDHYDRKYDADVKAWRQKVQGLDEIPAHLKAGEPFLWKYSDVEGFIDIFAADFERYSEEFKRLIEELPKGVRQCHAKSLRQIEKRRDSQNDRCRTFRTDYVVWSPWRDIAEVVHREVRATLDDYMDLNNAAWRLDALVGTSVVAGTKRMPKENGPRPIFQPTADWSEVVWKGTTVSLRKREKAKEFLRLLWDKGAKRRSAAVAAGKRFEKPSSLFLPGERNARTGSGPTVQAVAVGSERGEMIHRVYSNAVGKVPPAKKGKGTTKYYLRVFADSDST